MLNLFQAYHCVKHQNFTKFPDVKIFWKGTVPATLREMCLSTKFPPQQIR